MKLSALIKILVISGTPMLLSGCFTGIEGTKKIELSKSDRQATLPTAEDDFWADIAGVPISGWERGKAFRATDDRAALIFDQKGLPPDYRDLALKGKEIRYAGTSAAVGMDGSASVVVLFEADSLLFPYNSGKDAAEIASLKSTDIPMLVDCDLIEAVKGKVIGKQLWTRTPLWYDTEGTKTAGMKFVPVTVNDVRLGNEQFPLAVVFRDAEGNEAMMWMNAGNGPLDSRSFPSLFSLTDPKNAWPKISPETWELIQQGSVKEGMTKEECKLALGTPANVQSGHDYSQTIDIWVYSDGRVLRFLDGLLVSDKLK